MNKEQEERLKQIGLEIKASRERVKRYNEQLREIDIGLTGEFEVLKKLSEEQEAIEKSIKQITINNNKA